VYWIPPHIFYPANQGTAHIWCQRGQKNSSSSAAELSYRKVLRFRPLALRPRLSVGFAIIGEKPMLCCFGRYITRIERGETIFCESFVNTATAAGNESALELTKRAKMLYNSPRLRELEISLCAFIPISLK